MLNPVDLFTQGSVGHLECLNLAFELPGLLAHGEVLRQPHVIEHERSHERSCDEHREHDQSPRGQPLPLWRSTPSILLHHKRPKVESQKP